MKTQVVCERSGKIRYTQDTYDPEGLAVTVRALGLSIVEVEVDGPIDTAAKFIGLVDRPEFQVAIDKTEIVADGADVAKITGVPPGTTIKVSVGDDQLTEEICPDDFIDFVTDQVGTHRITLSGGHYLPETIEIVAVLPPVPVAEPEPDADQGEP
jgi:hypothetical protein